MPDDTLLSWGIFLTIDLIILLVIIWYVRERSEQKRIDQQFNDQSNRPESPAAVPSAPDPFFKGPEP